MTDATTATTPRLRLNIQALIGYLLIVAGLAVMLTDVAAKSGQTILGLELTAAGTLLVATVLRRQALRRSR